MPRTKIVCTIGPACETKTQLLELARAGMDVARLNFSHGSHDWHGDRIRLLRQVAEETGRALAILQDLCGPKLRLGPIPEPGIELLPGRACVLTAGPSAAVDPPRLQVPIPELLAALRLGQDVYLRDAQIHLRVASVSGAEARCEVLIGGTICSRQGLTVPSLSLELAAATEKDLADLRFALAQGIDWVAMSFVRCAADLQPVRAVIEEAGFPIPLIAQIEKPEAVENLAEIAAAADGRMVARGDLGVEMPLFQVPVLQKQIIRLGTDLGKPVITATQMLESMTQNPRPTRAEATDVANAILDGTDAVMLSGETAVGKWPAVVVQTMAQIAEHTEQHLDYRAHLERRLRAEAGSITEAIAQGACEIASDLKAAAILCSTTSGATARALSRMRPPMPLVAATPDDAVRCRLALSWGVQSVLVPPTTDTDRRLADTVEAARAAGHVRPGEIVVLAAGTPVGTPGHTNLIKVQKV